MTIGELAEQLRLALYAAHAIGDSRESYQPGETWAALPQWERIAWCKAVAAVLAQVKAGLPVEGEVR